MAHIHEKIDFTVAIFVVHDEKILLIHHRKLNKWLPLGGHIELDEDPEQAALREAKEAPLKIANMEETALKMRAEGASEDDIYRMRAKAFSPEAAARLADLDRQVLDWNKRIAIYQSDRKSLLDNASLSDPDRQAAIQQLRDAHFSSDEQKRLAAYE